MYKEYTAEIAELTAQGAKKSTIYKLIRKVEFMLSLEGKRKNKYKARISELESLISSSPNAELLHRLDALQQDYNQLLEDYESNKKAYADWLKWKEKNKERYEKYREYQKRYREQRRR